MKNKKAFNIILLSLFGLVVSTIFSYPDKLSICSVSDSVCIYKITENFTQPVGMLSITLLICGISLLFLRPEVFKTWSKFAMAAIPLAVIWIALTPVQSSSGGTFGIGIAETRESVTWIASILFLVISLIIIAVKSYKLRH